MDVVVSVKRAARDAVPEDWAEQVLAMPGITSEGTPAFGRLLLTVSDESLVSLRAQWGDHLNIEAQIRYHRTDE